MTQPRTTDQEMRAREKRVLELMAQGKVVPQIALEMKLSRPTLHMTLSRLRRRRGYLTTEQMLFELGRAMGRREAYQEIAQARKVG